METIVNTNKKVEVIFKQDIIRKSPIIFDKRVGCNVLNKIDNVETLNEL